MCDKRTLMDFKTARRPPTAVFSTGTSRSSRILPAASALNMSTVKALSENLSWL